MMIQAARKVTMTSNEGDNNGKGGMARDDRPR